MIRIVEDVGAPAAVVGIDMLTLELAPTYNEIAAYVMAGGGYVAGALGLGGRTVQGFLTNMGIAALPLAARAIRERVKAAGVGSRAGAGATRLAFRRTTSNPGPVQRQYQPEFEQAGAHAF